MNHDFEAEVVGDQAGDQPDRGVWGGAAACRSGTADDHGHLRRRRGDRRLLRHRLLRRRVLRLLRSQRGTASAASPSTRACSAARRTWPSTGVCRGVKVILGAPFVGSDWSPTTGRWRRPPLAGSRHRGTPGAVERAQYWDPLTHTAWTSYQVGGQWHESDHQGANGLYDVRGWASCYGARGVGIWALGMESDGRADDRGARPASRPVRRRGRVPGPTTSSAAAVPARGRGRRPGRPRPDSAVRPGDGAGAHPTTAAAAVGAGWGFDDHHGTPDHHDDHPPPAPTSTAMRSGVRVVSTPVAANHVSNLTPSGTVTDFQSTDPRFSCLDEATLDVWGEACRSPARGRGRQRRRTASPRTSNCCRDRTPPSRGAQQRSPGHGPGRGRTGARRREEPLPPRHRVRAGAPDRARLFWVADAAVLLSPTCSDRASSTPSSSNNVDGQPSCWARPHHHVGELRRAGHRGRNTFLALIQLGIGVGLRPAHGAAALVVSFGWVPPIWVIGEGMGMISTGTASAATGAPGSGAAVRGARPHGSPRPPRRDVTWSDRPVGVALIGGGRGPRTLRHAAGGVGRPPVAGRRALRVPRQPDADLSVERHRRDGPRPSRAAFSHFPHEPGQPVRHDGHADGLGLLAARPPSSSASGRWWPGARAGSCSAARCSPLLLWIAGQGLVGNIFTTPVTDPNTGPLVIVLAAAMVPTVRGAREWRAPAAELVRRAPTAAVLGVVGLGCRAGPERQLPGAGRGVHQLRHGGHGDGRRRHRGPTPAVGDGRHLRPAPGGPADRRPRPGQHALHGHERVAAGWT